MSRENEEFPSRKIDAKLKKLRPHDTQRPLLIRTHIQTHISTVRLRLIGDEELSDSRAHEKARAV